MEASGNGHERLDAALAIVHWYDLDRDVPSDDPEAFNLTKI